MIDICCVGSGTKHHSFEEFQGVPYRPLPPGIEPYYPPVCAFSVNLNVRYKYVENK